MADGRPPLPPPEWPATVVFMHGLESGPNGRKAAWLRARFPDVRVPDMHMSLLDLRARNGIARSLLRLLPSTLPWNVAAHAMRVSLEDCVAAQAEALEGPGPGLVVASSWGAAVALVAIARGLYAGPALLLAPALGRVAAWCAPLDPGLSASTLHQALGALPAEMRARMVVVHGTGDPIVPLADSLALCRAAGLRLVAIQGGTHSLNEALTARAAGAASAACWPAEEGLPRGSVVLRGWQDAEGDGVEKDSTLHGNGTAHHDVVRERGGPPLPPLRFSARAAERARSTAPAAADEPTILDLLLQEALFGPRLSAT